MQLTVKTLKGEKFVVNAEPSNTVAEVKTIIVSWPLDLVLEIDSRLLSKSMVLTFNMKRRLIHSLNPTGRTKV